MEDLFKQKYLFEAGPTYTSQTDFHAERASCFVRLLRLIQDTPRNNLLLTDISCITLIHSYKRVYGLSSEQFEQILSLLFGYFRHEAGLTSNTKLLLLKTLNSLTEYQIKIAPSFKVDNLFFLQQVSSIVRSGSQGTIKTRDSYEDQLFKLIRFFCKFGEEVVAQAMDLARERRDLRFLVLFLKSLRQEESAQLMLKEIFVATSFWQRGQYWFEIIIDVLAKFPKIDFSSYYHIFLQKIIRTFTTLADPPSVETVAKLLQSDNNLEVRSILRANACVLVWMIKPTADPMFGYIWTSIERIFSQITLALDHVKNEGSVYFLEFLLTFAESFAKRYRRERKMFVLANEDCIEDQHGQPEETQLVLCAEVQARFEILWGPIIPKILYFEDLQENVPSKILSTLAMYKPEPLLDLSFIALETLIVREDFSMISLNSSKVFLLTVAQFVAKEQSQYLLPYVKCCNYLLEICEKLGIAENIDIVELSLKAFSDFTEEQLQQPCVQQLADDLLALILANLDAISIGLESYENEQGELYIDLSNMFFPLFVRLDQQQLGKFTERFLYKLTTNTPQNKKVYELLSIILGFVAGDFPQRVMLAIYPQIIQPDRHPAQTRTPKDSHRNKPTILGAAMFQGVEAWVLATQNENNIKYYSIIIQCIFQYHPMNIVRHWSQLETLIDVLLASDNQVFVDQALDLLYNVMLCLSHEHFGWAELLKPRNNAYRGLQIDWEVMPQPVRDLFEAILQKYYFKLIECLQLRYRDRVATSPLSNKSTAASGQQQQISQYGLQLVECVLMEDLCPEEVEQRKLLLKIVSVQYTILSAVMFRMPLHEHFDLKQGYFQEHKTFRRDACQYLDWLLKLMASFKVLSEPTFMRLYDFFSRQAHDELSFTAQLQITYEKLAPFFPYQFYKHKELLRCAFYLINEVYAHHVSRIQFFSCLAPTAYLNDPHYLTNSYLVYVSPHLELSLHSMLPSCLDLHDQHRELLAVCRYHLDPNQPNSYAWRYLQESDCSPMQERLLAAIKTMLLVPKKLVKVMNNACCMLDHQTHETLIDLMRVYRLVNRTLDKKIVIELYCLSYILGFDAQLLTQQSATNFPHESPTPLNGHSERVASTGNVAYFVERIVVKILAKMDQPQEKDMVIYLVALACYYNLLPLDTGVFPAIMRVLARLLTSRSPEIFDYSKLLLFRIVNRYSRSKMVLEERANQPVKRPFEEFLDMRLIGGLPAEDYSKIFCEKYEHIFYQKSHISLISHGKLDPAVPNEKILLEYLQADVFGQFVRNAAFDHDLKNTQQEETLGLEDKPGGMSVNGHRLLHYLWERNHFECDPFANTVDNLIPRSTFYHRLIRKVIRLTASPTVELITKVAKELRSEHRDIEESRLSVSIASEVFLASPQTSDSLQFIQFLTNCSKQIFQFALQSFYSIFSRNFMLASKAFAVTFKEFKNLKGVPRLRYLQVLNIYISAEGRFARAASKECIAVLRESITEGSNEIADVVIGMISECFIISINLHTFPQWCSDSAEVLSERKVMHRVDQTVAYEIEEPLKRLLGEIIARAREEERLTSNNLKIYSQIVNKILSNITIRKFNDAFYDLLKQIIFYIVEKAPSDDQADQIAIYQLKDSEYPENIYKELIKFLTNFNECSQGVVKKKLRYLQGIVFNRCFFANCVEIPDILALPNKSVTLDYIVAYSQMARVMTSQQMERAVDGQLAKGKPDTNKLMSYLLAAGVRELAWKKRALTEIVKLKKTKLVKEFISEWWRGKSPQNEEQIRLSRLVKVVETPYSYFA